MNNENVETMDTNNPNNSDPAQELSIELTEDIAEGIYSNLAIITHLAYGICIGLRAYHARDPQSKSKIKNHPDA